MSKPYSIVYLHQDFYSVYNTTEHPEIMGDPRRPYMVLLVKINNNTFAIPFRTNIRHNCCYKFQHSHRATQSVTGLDFSKAVIVNDTSYIGNPATIDNGEYVELSRKHYFIVKQFENYVNGYFDYVNGTCSEHDAIKYRYTTLKYFHTELGIKIED